MRLRLVIVDTSLAVYSCRRKMEIMSALPGHGNIESINAQKSIEVGSQPNTDTWKLETVYTNPKTLIGNWYEQRSKLEVCGGSGPLCGILLFKNFR